MSGCLSVPSGLSSPQLAGLATLPEPILTLATTRPPPNQRSAAGFDAALYAEKPSGFAFNNGVCAPCTNYDAPSTCFPTMTDCMNKFNKDSTSIGNTAMLSSNFKKQQVSSCPP